ncbi:MAG: PAS domain-containing protein, partial [Fibrobacter sp.]|nr:PAS domain-containing protein [Fibrobacter sp.]
NLTVLLVGASEAFELPVRRILQTCRIEFTIENARDYDELKEIIGRKHCNVILYCYKSSSLSASAVSGLLQSRGMEIPVILICSGINDDVAAYAISSGVHNIVTDFETERLITVIDSEIRNSEKKIRNRSTEIIRSGIEEKYKLLIESIDDVFFALDMNLKCVYWNKAAENLTRMTAKSAMLRPLAELFPNETSAEIENALYEVLLNKHPVTKNVTVINENRKCNHQMSFFPSKYVISVLSREAPEDKITCQLQKTQEQMKLQLAQSQELRLLGQLTSGVAHEVRNPLNAISVVIEALFQELGENSEYQVYKEHIFTHVDRLKRLMQDLLELGKPMEKSKVVSLYSLDLIRESVALWKSSGPHQNFRVMIENEGTSEAILRGNPLKLQQVFMNILENASQHSEENSLIRISHNHDETWCTIRIQDEGNGIKPEYLQHLFEPFFTTRKRGTGLGLAIVKHIVEVHRGTISMGNNTDRPGCTVVIKLPTVGNRVSVLSEKSIPLNR